jgi:TonB family protein
MHYAGADGDIPALFSSVAAMPLPACAPLTGLTPDTVAVIEFAVGNDGRVSGVTPIYARRGTGMGKAGGDDQGPEVLFAEAVRDWYWPANAVQKLDGFWRQAIRVELRCLTQRQADNPVYASLGGDFAAWYSQLGIAPMPDVEGNDATILPADRAELARREAAYGASSPQLLQPLNALANNGAAPAAERVAAANRWETLFLQTAPDPQLRLAMQVWKTMMLASTEQSSESAHRQVVRSLMPLVQQADADGLGDTRTGMAARLLLANYLTMTGANAKAQPLYQAVAAAPESLLPANDPMRLQALLYMADMAARKGDLASASDAISATGLAPEQCALIDVRPQRINGTVSEQSFPAMAKSWGSSGYVKTGFDISTDGRPQNVRTVISSPPFIFGPETEKAIAKFRYSPVFRPGNTVGCSAQTQSVRFRAAAGY